MRDSVPSVKYSSVYNVLHLWNISLIPTYRVCRLYDKRTLCIMCADRYCIVSLQTQPISKSENILNHTNSPGMQSWSFEFGDEGVYIHTYVYGHMTRTIFTPYIHIVGIFCGGIIFAYLNTN